MGMRVLVTGGSGFIGRAVGRELVRRGHQVAPFDLPNDVRDAGRVSAAVSHCDAVVHLAGVLGTAELFDTPRLPVEVNVLGTLNVLEACRDHGAGYVGITMPQVFPSLYTASKVHATLIASAYHREYGVPVSHVRAFNAFGAGQKHGPTHPRKIVPAFAADAWNARPIVIWGDGEQTVDLIHVDQLGRMLVDALDHGDDVTFDGGTGQAFTVNEVAQMVLDITCSAAGVEHRPMRRGEVPTFIVAKGEGWERLGWRPSFDRADLIDTVVDYRSHA